MSLRPAHLAMACAIALLAGCGTGSSASTAAEPSATVAPPPPLTPEKAKAVAAAGVLTGKDLPGFAFERNVPDRSAKGAEAQFEKCIGTKMPDYLARHPGYIFTRNGAVISSSADVAKTTAQAQADFELLTGPKGQKCTLKIFEREVAGPGVRIRSGQIKKVPVSIPGAHSAFGFTIEITATMGKRAGRVEVVMLGAVVGQAEIALAVVPGREGVTLEDARAYLTAVVARAEAAALTPASTA